MNTEVGVRIAALKIENTHSLLAEHTCLEGVLTVLITTITYHHFEFKTVIMISVISTVYS